uniref:Transposase n=1 Tax=Ascaris lumbricoides TaxID=6252 RepID=A0A0M3I0N0_ASCLU
MPSIAGYKGHISIYPTYTYPDSHNKTLKRKSVLEQICVYTTKCRVGFDNDVGTSTVSVATILRNIVATILRNEGGRKQVEQAEEEVPVNSPSAT